jgi:autotransporter-associated beta strand protein
MNRFIVGRRCNPGSWCTPIAGAMLAVLLAFWGLSASAVDMYNIGGTQNWANNKWTTGASSATQGVTPTAADRAIFNNDAGDGLLTVSQMNATTRSVLGLVFRNSGTTVITSGNVTAATLTIGGSGIDVRPGAGQVVIGGLTGGAPDPNNKVLPLLAASQTWQNDSLDPLIVLGGGVSNIIDLANFNLTLGGTGAGGFTLPAVTLGSGTLTAGGGGPTVIEGAITGSGAVVKNGAGTLTLAAANTFGGSTTVNAGTLLVNGTSSGSGAVTVASGATLGGSGLIAGATTIQAGGTLSPGESPGVLGFSSDLTLLGSTLMEIDGLTRGLGYDGVDIGGAIAYGGTLELAFGNVTAFGDGAVFNLFDFTSQSGDFASVSSTGFYSGTWADTGNGTFTLIDGDSTLVFAQQTGNLEISVVPEPSAFMLGLGGVALLGLAGRTHRRCRSRSQGPCTISVKQKY